MKKTHKTALEAKQIRKKSGFCIFAPPIAFQATIFKIVRPSFLFFRDSTEPRSNFPKEFSG